MTKKSGPPIPTVADIKKLMQSKPKPTPKKGK